MGDNTQEPVNKAESYEDVVVPSTREVGQPHIVTSGRFIADAKKKELVIQNRLCTFEAMTNDDAVYTGLHVTNIHTIKSLSKGKVVGAPSSNKSKIAADFLNYNLHNFSYGSWLQACRDMVTATKNGWSDLNIVLERRKHGKYKNNLCLRKLSPRSPNSVYGWLWNENLTEWKGFVQKPPLKKSKVTTSFRDGLTELNVRTVVGKDYTVLKAKNLLHTAINSTMNNPQGDSPLMHCYDPWMEKKLIEQFEMTAMSKDLVGLALLRVPSELIKLANEDPTSDAATEYAALQQNMADFNAGKSSYMILTSDHDPNSKIFDYDFKLAGVDGGGGKQYQTSEVIDQKRKSIYNCFGAQAALLGQDGSGSYALSSSLTSMHGSYVENYVNQYADVINTQLIPRLLAANNIYLDHKDMPVFVPADPDEMSIDEIFKAVQRGASVDKLTPQALTWLFEKGGLPTEGIDELDFTSSGDSRSGDGMKTAGEGTAQSVKGGDKSVANNENGGVEKKLHTDKNTDRIIDVDSGKCINEHELDKQGFYK